MASVPPEGREGLRIFAVQTTHKTSRPILNFVSSSPQEARRLCALYDSIRSEVKCLRFMRRCADGDGGGGDLNMVQEVVGGGSIVGPRFVHRQHP